MIKGHAKIELTDERTGKREIYEHDNMVTNGISNFLQYACGKVATLDDPQWSTIVGGIMLFDTALPENADKCYSVGTATMVGNGWYNYGNAKDVPETGSFNGTESGVQDDGSLKMVYDFTTSQANGTISSICLSSALGAAIGLGNASGKTDGVERDIYSSSSISNIEKGYPALFDASAKRFYIVYVVNGKLVIYKYSIDIGQIDIRNNKYGVSLLSTKEATLPSGVTSISAIGQSVDKAYFYITGQSTVAKGDEIKIYKVNAETGASTLIQFTNNLGGTINLNYSCVVGDKYLISKAQVAEGTYSWKVCAVNINNATDYGIGEFGFSSGNTTTIGIDEHFAVTYDVGIRIGDTASSIVTNRIEGQCENQNTRFDKGLMLSRNGLSNNPTVGRYYPYLATINNLSDPITKTAAQSMKITYTLTFD